MKNFKIILTLAVILFTQSAWADVSQGIYQLHPGDTLQVSVWKEDSLLKQLVVLPDGSINFPLIGRVEVAGLATPEVEQRIANKLKEFFPDPIVSVVILGIDGHRAYVTGKVLRPGPLVMNGTLTALQAISMAGGLDKFADLGGIKVIRQTKNGQIVLPVNYKEIISGKDMSSNIQLQVGDTLVVP